MSLAVVASAWPAVAGAGPRVALDTSEYHFGAVRRGDDVRRTFTIRNTGDTPLEVTAVRLSMPGMTANLPTSIDAGAEGTVVLQWTTDRVQGTVRGVATVDTNDPRQPSRTLTLVGTVQPRFDIEPEPMIVLSTFVGDDVRRELTLRSRYARPVSLRVEPGPDAHYVAELEPLEAGRSWRLTVAAAPDTAPGRYDETLTIDSDDPAVGRVGLSVHMFVKAELSASPETVDFGEISASLLRQRPSALDQLVILSKREGTFRIRDVRSDVPALEVRATPATGDSAIFRITATLQPDRLKTDSVDGTIWIETDDEEFPRLALPVRGRLVDR